MKPLEVNDRMVSVAPFFDIKFPVRKNQRIESAVVFATGRDGDETEDNLRECEGFASTLNVRRFQNVIEEDFNGVTATGSKALLSLIDTLKRDHIDVVIVAGLHQLPKHPQSLMAFLSLLQELKTRVVYPGSYVEVESQVLLNPASLTPKHIDRAFVYNRVPFGYKRKQGEMEIEIHPERSRSVKHIFEKLAKGVTTSEICRSLKVPHPGTCWALDKGETFTELPPWSTYMIVQTVKNQIYKGRITQKKRIRNPEGSLPWNIPREDLRIVSDELWDAANQAIYDSPRSRAKRAARSS